MPARQIPRLHYPTEIDRDRFEREFAAQSQPCIISGLIDDWPAYADPARMWRGDRWDKYMGENIIDLSFDPKDNRIMHFGDDEGEPGTMFNPGRLKLPLWAFLEVGRIRQYILEVCQREGSERVRLEQHPDLRKRLQRELEVQNVPFIAIDKDIPLHFFHPIQVRMRDLVPLAFYLSFDTYSLPCDMQMDMAPQASKLCPGWQAPNSSRVWISSGGNWKVPFPPWSADSAPEPAGEQTIFSCFHCDRMENFHSLISGEKEVVLVPPGQKDILKSTRFSTQSQWLVAPVADFSGKQTYLGSTLMSNNTIMDFQSDQSSVHPLRPAADNRRVTKGAWPDEVDVPITVGRLRKGDTLYIPAYHWHWVATSTPPALGQHEDGPLAMSVNFWWWPIHNDAAMERWSYQNELTSWENRRVPSPQQHAPPDCESHGRMFRQMTSTKRSEAGVHKPWPCPPPLIEFEVVD